jgi:hypothetical protein
MAQQTRAAGKVTGTAAGGDNPATDGDRSAQPTAERALTAFGDPYLRYIEKTHAYYRRKGTGADYIYAHHTDGPFTPLRKPLAKSRLMLVTSAGLEIVPEGGPVPVPFKGINVGPKDLVEVFDIPGDLPKERLVYVTGAHNRAESPMTDIDAFFPLTAVRALQREGRVGSLARNFLRIRPAYSQRKTRELDAPEVLRRALALGVDVALLVPV